MTVVPTDAWPRGGTKGTRVPPPSWVARCPAVSSPLRGWPTGWNGSRPRRVVAKEVPPRNFSFKAAPRRGRAERLTVWKEASFAGGPLRTGGPLGRREGHRVTCGRPRGPSCQRMWNPLARRGTRGVQRRGHDGGGGRGRVPCPGDRERRATPQPPLPTPFTQVSKSLSRHRRGAATRSRYVSRGSAGSPPPFTPPPTMDDGMPTTTHARPYGTCRTTVASARAGLPPAPSRPGRASTRPHGDSPPPRRESAAPLVPAHLTSRFSTPTLRGGAGGGGRRADGSHLLHCRWTGHRGMSDCCFLASPEECCERQRPNGCQQVPPERHAPDTCTTARGTALPGRCSPHAVAIAPGCVY